MRTSPVNWCVFCLSLAIAQVGYSRGSVIDPRLEQTLGNYFESTGTDVANNGKKLDRLLELLTDYQVSPCELSSELYAKRPLSEARVEYLLRDIVDNKTRQIEVSYELILEKLGTQKRLSDRDRDAVRKLAVQTAATSTSVTELRESIIPGMFDGISEKLGRVDEIRDKVDFLDLELRRNISTICDRLAVLEADLRRRQLEGDYAALKQPQIDAHASPSSRPIFRGDAEVSWRTVNGTQWEPERYATSSQLCRNPTLKWENVIFDTRRKINGAWTPVRHYGDIWIDCSGDVVMVLKR